MDPSDDNGGANGGGGTIHSASEHGTVASHPSRDTQPFRAAPTTGTDFNTVGLDLVVVACLSLHDILFDFDSSFVNPGVTVILKELPGLRDAHKNAKGQLPPVSVFGHADPVGEDEYNKQLSGRRARAIYGLLTHDLGIWNALFQAEWSSKDVLKTIRERLGAPTGTARDKLFQDYMKLLFPTPLAKGDFLGQGASSKGLADFQGCADFNPLIVLSNSENQTLLHSVRNSRNQPDRRVVVFLYKAGTKINTNLWPCPAATEGTAKCRLRFFAGPPPGDQRRKPGPVHKEFTLTKDTFACRFYDRMARFSPCEDPAPIQPVGPLINVDATSVASGQGKALVGAGAITPSKLVVVVAKPHTTPARQRLTLKSDAAFDGTGKFSVSGNTAAISFFKAATGGNPIVFNGADDTFTGAQLTAGVPLFAEGTAGSASTDDVILTLTFSGGSKPVKPPVSTKGTAVDLGLDICQSRTAAGADPVPMSETDKISVGRFVHVQDANNHHGRAMLIVRQPKPANFSGTLVLTGIGAHVRLFADEVAAGGQAALPTPRNIAASSIPAAGLKLFVQGASVSGALRDSGFRLGVQGGEADADHVQLTAVQFSNLQATITATPSRKAASGAVPPHVFQVGAGATPAPAAFDEDFTTNSPVVLIQGSLAASSFVKLTVNIAPAGVKIGWGADRDTRPAPDGDHANVIAASPNPVPTVLTLNSGEGQLSDDAVGSFHVRAFVNCNTNSGFDGNDAVGKRFEREPFIAMNLVLVRATLNADNSQSHNVFTFNGDAGGGIAVSSGSFNVNAPATAAVHLNGLADLIGGGGDGRRGLDQVFSGWIQALTAPPATIGTYNAVPPTAVTHQDVQVFASNRASATGGNPGALGAIFLPPDPAPTIVDPNILDTGRNGAGQGGNSATLTRSRIRTRTNLAVGQQLLVEAVDSPGNGDNGTHPGFAGFRLTNYQFRFDFSAFLCVWTNHAKNIGATGDAADRLYAVLLQIDWHLFGQWSINPATNAVSVVTAPTSQITGRVTTSPARDATQTAVEVRTPRGLDLLAGNAQA